ncbi:MAG: LuxR C-terminal-related transcriptional regulator [Candidatus Marinimicrobia bacterium]|nr:LuxR C-terminal-related transcriptional regulator [Candidatus Neomarinimicrobiota bacterium]
MIKVNRKKDTAIQSHFPCFTDDEVTICKEIRRGFSAESIAKRLNMTIRTVETRKRKIREKMGLKKEETIITALYLLEINHQ